MSDRKMSTKSISIGDSARCAWAEVSPSERRYHDEEWGVPLYDDQRLFELLCLEGAQAGLSWRRCSIKGSVTDRCIISLILMRWRL